MKGLVIFLNLTIFAVYVLGELWMIQTVEDEEGPDAGPVCEGREGYDGAPVNRAFVLFWFIAVALIILWLVVSVCCIHCVLNKGIDDNFRKEKATIISMMVCFIVTYSTWALWNLYDEHFVGRSSFADVLVGDLFIPVFCNFVPITLVLLTHWKNVNSACRILKLAYRVSKDIQTRLSGDHELMVTNE